MVFLWIVIILAVLIIALLSLNFKLYLKFDGTTHIRAGIGPVVFTLLPQKKKRYGCGTTPTKDTRKISKKSVKSS